MLFAVVALLTIAVLLVAGEAVRSQCIRMLRAPVTATRLPHAVSLETSG